MKKLAEAFDALNIAYTDETLNQFKSYMDGVIDWNEKVNLTAITEHDEFIVKHFIDSVLCVGFDEYKAAKKVIDVGTGAGFPGVPLSIVSPDKKFVLMDSLNKRLKIIDELTAGIGVMNVETVHARAEELAKNKAHREQYDICVSRAVANLTPLSEYCLPFIKVGGYLLAYKGPDADAELADAKKAISILGGHVEKVEKAQLEDFGLDHRIIFIKKVKNTPAKHPRKAGTPAKEPLK